MKKHISIMGVLLVMVCLLAACGGGTASSSAGSASGAAASGASGKEATLILKNLTNPFFISVKEGGEAAAAKYGLNLTVLAPLKADNNEEQMQMVEQSIARQTDILVIIPADTNGIIPAVEKVFEANIPVVDLNTKIGGDKVMWKTFVAIENYDGGYMAVKKLCELMGSEGEIIIIEGVVGAQTSIDRVKGAHAAIAEFPKIKIVAQQSGEYNRAKGMDVVQNLLQAHPNVKAIFCCNDEMALGAVEAVEAAGKRGKILIAGIDANADAKQAIKDGKMTLSLDSQPYMQGYSAVEAAAKILSGEKVDERIVTEMAVVTKETL
ncbi:MAG: sugar ABC transporter substrate-binding protein [Spirochaetales bacterium]|jgi:ABC-type sugar transport system substrate-binding protein|nr:sugar ABC transporter substrate-binding protein [Spirochaetales bacterium]